MPNSTTHFLHAKRVLKEMSPEEKTHINASAYFWGAQGPDFFFCHRYFPWQKGQSLQEYGDKLHAVKPSVLLEMMRTFLSQNGNAIYRSYMLGFVCHYALDSTAHPYVNMLAAELLEDRPYETLTTLHAEIESSLDTVMLRRESGKLPTELRLKKFFPVDPPVNQSIATLYRAIFSDVFHTDISEEKLLEAQKDANRVFSVLTDRTGLKHKLFQRIEQNKPHKITSHLIPMTENAEIDYANTSESEWTADGVASTKTFFDLFQDAVSKAVIIQKEFDTCDFAVLTKNIPFNNKTS